MIEIIVTPQGAGRFMACLGERVILKSSRQPLLDAARVLLAEGVDPKACIQMRHAGSKHVALSATVGKAAKLTVDEHSGTVFAKWRPLSVSAVSPPMRFDEEGVPTLAPDARALCDEATDCSAPSAVAEMCPQPPEAEQREVS